MNFKLTVHIKSALSFYDKKNGIPGKRNHKQSKSRETVIQDRALKMYKKKELIESEPEKKTFYSKRLTE